MEEKYIAAIDLGTYKTALSVAKISGDDMQIVYYRERPSDGIRNSSVFNPMKASKPIEQAVRDAENELKIKILQVAVGLPRNNVLQETAKAMANRSNPQEYISKAEVEMLQDIARNDYPLDDDSRQEIYGAVTQSFSTDDEINIVEDDVIGTISSRIEGNFRLFIGQRSSTNTIDKVFNDLKISILKKYFLPDVVARTVLTEEEMENGVALIDFGAGVTSVSIYLDGIMRFYASIPFGGKDITNDIRKECGISAKLAENIKLAYGACMPSRLASLSDKILQIRYSNAPYKEIKLEHISKVIDARIREIIDAILYHIQESNFSDLLRTGVVITGGGANLVNLSTLIKDMSGYNVRVGYTRHLFSESGCPGVYETAATSVIGMLLAAKTDNLANCSIRTEDPVEETDGSVDIEETEEAAAAAKENMTVGDDVIENGKTGKLGMDFEEGEVTPKPKDDKGGRRWPFGGRKNSDKQKNPKNNFFVGVIWDKFIKETYDALNDDEI